MSTPPTSAMLTARARRLFDQGPAIWRFMQILRPYICPFQPVIEAVPPDSRVLDVGCGGGLLLGLLADLGRIRSGVGFDTSRVAVDLANRMAERNFPGRLTFQYLSADQAWPDQEFDVVTLIDVLHHIPPSAQPLVIAQAAQRVRPGGLVLVKDMVTRPLWRNAANVAHDLVLARQWIHTPGGRDIAAWAVSAGLTERDEQVFNALWYGHRLQVFSKEGMS